jgi:hypothetical protein
MWNLSFRTAEWIGDKVREGLVEWEYWRVRVLMELEEGLNQVKKVHDLLFPQIDQGSNCRRCERVCARTTAPITRRTFSSSLSAYPIEGTTET